MLDYIELETVLWILVTVTVLLCIQLDRFSRHATKHIDLLQMRVQKLEERLGIKYSRDFNDDDL